jgi:hypoxanthine-guanine phosphoribosyltransferase
MATAAAAVADVHAGVVDAVSTIHVGSHTDLKSQAGAAGAATEVTYDIHDDVGEVLFTREQLAAKTAELGRRVGADFQSLRPLLMPILKGGFICECIVCVVLGLSMCACCCLVTAGRRSEAGRARVC